MNMKKKNKAKLRKPPFITWLDSSIRTLLDLYGVGGTTINLRKSVKEDNSEARMVALTIRYSTSYKTADIWYYPLMEKLYEEGKYSLLRQAITHEVAHILTTALADAALDRFSTKKEIDKEIEALTESIGQLCRSLMDAKNISLQ